MTVGMKLAKKLHVNHVMHFREFGDLDFGFRYFPSKSSCKQLFFSTKSYAIAITRGILAHHGLSDYERASVVYNGIVGADELAIAATPKANYFLYAGRITPTKGLMQLVEAYCDYCKSAEAASVLPLKVAGGVEDEAYMNSIKQYLDAHGQTDKVEFLGARTDIKSLMQDAKALIIPSKMEGFGRCMVEAMAVGCLCIGHDTGGTKEQFDNGLKLTGAEIGLRYTTESQLVSLLRQVAEREENSFSDMKSRARRTVMQLYSVEQSVEQVIKLYNSMLSG